MKLYGTRTSPYVRRVRIVAEMVGATLEMVDTSTDEGQTILRTITPIWKVPVLEDGTNTIFDSTVISEYLIRRFGNRNLRTDSGVGRWRERNLATTIDGALDSSINHFYLARDGANTAEVAYLQKQQARTESALDWIEKQLDGGYFTDVPRIGLVEIALVTTLDWMIFRKTYPVERHGALSTFLETHRELPAFARTRPTA